MGFLLRTLKKSLPCRPSQLWHARYATIIPVLNTCSIKFERHVDTPNQVCTAAGFIGLCCGTFARCRALEVVRTSRTRSGAAPRGRFQNSVHPPLPIPVPAAACVVFLFDGPRPSPPPPLVRRSGSALLVASWCRVHCETTSLKSRCERTHQLGWAKSRSGWRVVTTTLAFGRRE